MISVSEKAAVNAGTVSFWPIGFNLLSYKKMLNLHSSCPFGHL
jgi:multiple sugar transport system permease protein/putative aldouronate transport system permease protein